MGISGGHVPPPSVHPYPGQYDIRSSQLAVFYLAGHASSLLVLLLLYR